MKDLNAITLSALWKEWSFTVAQPLIIQYTNLLHKYGGPQAGPVQDFLKQHSDDAVFTRRAEVLNKVFSLKQQLVSK